MAELYLIAHKVRGEPAFDVATCEDVEGETHWIIPTSGHRAYPYWHLEIDHLTVAVPILPDDLPDHYTARAAPRRSTEPPDFIRRMLAARPPSAPINRRGF